MMESDLTMRALLPTALAGILLATGGIQPVSAMQAASAPATASAYSYADIADLEAALYG